MNNDEIIPMTQEAVEILSLLASGWVIDTIGDSPRLIQEHKLDSRAFDELQNFTKYLKQFANCGGYWISDEGKKAYIKSTDELSSDFGVIYRSKTFLP